MEQVVIKPLGMDEWDLATALIWRVFLRCNAPDLEQEGIESFLNFISDEHLKMFCRLEEFEMLGAYLGHRLVGAAMLRQKTHISLLFVDTTYQKKGIGRAFIRYFTALTKQRGGGSLTVNATPFAQQFYYRMGFQDAGPMEVKEGVRYYPMILSFGAVLT